jgi:hypothetical protein
MELEFLVRETARRSRERADLTRLAETSTLCRASRRLTRLTTESWRNAWLPAAALDVFARVPALPARARVRAAGWTLFVAGLANLALRPLGRWADDAAGAYIAAGALVLGLLLFVLDGPIVAAAKERQRRDVCGGRPA